jgi:hypothetical protein
MLSLADESAIAAVILRYASGVDSRDWGLLRTCFTEDFVGEFGPAGTWHGPDEVIAYMDAGSKTGGASLHRMTNIVIKGGPESATARSYVDAVVMPKEQGGPGFHSIAYFDDVLVRTPAGWRIKHRSMTRVKFTENGRGAAG